MAAITDQGFIRPTYAQLLAAQVARAKEYFGDDVSTAGNTALGKFIRIGVYDLAALYEDLEGVYFARFPNFAAGVQLDRLMPFAGISRNPAAAVFAVRFTGQPDARLDAGLLLSTADGVMFRTEAPLQLDETGAATANVTCTVRGESGNVAAGAIAIIVNPDARLDNIQQLAQVSMGAAREGDASLRARFSAAIAGVGSATADAVRAAVLRVPGVLGCTVRENDGAAPDATGIPAHSFEVFVLANGALDADVAAAIFAKKPLGVKSHGSVIATVLDEGGARHEVRFSRVGEIPLKIRMKAMAASTFPADGAARIAASLSAHVNAFPAGKDLVYSSLYPIIYGVPGVAEARDLAVSSDGGQTYKAANVAVTAAAAVRLSAADVAVEVEPYVDD